MKKAIFLALLMVFALCTQLLAAQLFAGYAKLPWGSSMKSVTKAYPKGQSSKMGAQDIYKQVNPSKELRQRTFAFQDEKLVAVTVTFSPEYVKKTGAEKILEKQVKQYGEGMMDKSSAPHMVSYKWQGDGIKITFGYAPHKPEMTMMMFEKK